MKRFLGVTLFLLLVVIGQAKKLEAYFSYSTFYSQESGPYIETYLSIVGETVIHKFNQENNFQGTVEVLYIFYQNDQIANFKKFNLLSPAVLDTNSAFPNFLDQQRILLPNGKYLLEIQLTDINNPEKPVTSLQEIEIDYSANQVEVSQVEFVESFTKSETPGILTKSGYDVVPYVSDFFPDNLSRLKFYCEVYNSKKLFGEGSMYLIKYFIEKYENGKALSNYMGFIRQNSEPVNVILREINIEKLPSGNYHLVIEVRNRENELIDSRKTFFQRLNPNLQIDPDDFNSINVAETFADQITNRDTLAEYINSLRPISDVMEANFVDNNMKSAELEMLQKFFYSFWYNRNEFEPEREWMKYNASVGEAEKSFGFLNVKGYDSDRGRIYLKYGKPNQITTRYNEPSSYPYEIWHYYKTNVRADAKFVFYNPSLVPDNFELLHSNVYGELRDYRWQVRLQKRNEQNPNLDVERGVDHFGNPINNFFENPR